ncbi:gliotoxin biosynthesis protein GliK [Pyrenophora tritici-repentis]|uniref:gamma-glutamylcyclotransferase n=2 Tax=Pyrenophora tritici-repentis TaxID=45151 RepID=A0A2W1CJU8_9PLEO|nr:gliotoxin biosynthesis protein GliK [Pyrenophora tritici-repentis Pt-1C-BFP]KAA8627367.1 Gliotoxin biosynthesis protein GliK [Pyrenophora tritici-repentis]EDU41847.1 gliotoxin biosynthesis protein GliK [Pyrenophora tritici-repentis Pt-1C-BFP]KAF7442607.1 Gliotoxin biosynthesis protein GliK [Pyrenophora tritici-repentis]KAF7579017.1 AIG2-2 domain containing protein [Pyrenophora tritici-repentis]KAG9377950.1 Gliotoxin biosynthesis protein GliK [Pyrenophora tritici-repentis]
MVVFDHVPRLSQARLDASLTDAPLDAKTLASQPLLPTDDKAKTVLYLAYGSNLCDETFRGVRGIHPLSQVNVLVPSLKLTFDLPGIPYQEPCFANTALRVPDAQDYHKDRWHKGLVGVVYEVTLADYAHIIATEGGGSAYNDILVDCHVLPPAATVPASPDSKPFKAHTLFAPIVDNHHHQPQTSDRVTRPDPSYAQPSARYLKLITDGAAQRNLPAEYQDYLHEIRTYTITTKKQKIGKMIFLGIWMPFVMFVFTLARKMQDKHGRAPSWLAKLSALLFAGMWMSYDSVFKGTFGDGERTIGDEAMSAMDDVIVRRESSSRYDAEKEALLEEYAETI